MAAVAVRPLSFASYHPHISLMHQGRGLQRLPRFFMGQLGRCQFPQLLIDQRQELLRGRGIAGFDLREDAGDVGHEKQNSLAG